MSIMTMVGELFRPVTKIVDDLHTSEEEKFTIKKEMAKLESDIQLRVLEYEKQMIQAKSSIINTEANGQSWLQRSWRPITMLTFLFLVVCDSFGW